MTDTHVAYLGLIGYFGVILLALMVIVLGVVLIHDIARDLADQRAARRGLRNLPDDIDASELRNLSDVADAYRIGRDGDG